jgi:adenine-specific DNA-methyltransferase
LNMMYPRLKVAKDLLTDDGVIFISIDDNEVDNLRKVCDEIFGEDNFIARIMPVVNPGGRDYNQIALTHEYLLVYGKTDNAELNEISKDVDFKMFDGFGGYELRDLRNRNPKFHSGNRPNLFYPFYISSNMKDDYGNYAVSLKPTTEYTIEIKPYNSQGKESVWRWGRTKAQENINLDDVNNSQIIAKENRNGGWTICEKNRRVTTKVKSIWNETDMRTENGTRQIREIFNFTPFDHPKPIFLIKRLLELSGQEGTVLDFFAGSSTTAHATMQFNSENGGNRKFIMVQLPELTDEKSETYKAGYKNICEIGKERIRRAGDKIKHEVEEYNAQLKMGEELKPVPDIGFKVFRTADTNIKWNLIESEGQMDTEAMTHTPDLADFTFGFNDIDVVYEIMLRQKDIPLSEKLEVLSDIGARTYLYGGAYLICLEIEITEDLIDQLASLNPLPIKFVFRDSAFKDDISLKDDTFRRLKNLIDRNSGENKNTYTVEDESIDDFELISFLVVE